MNYSSAQKYLYTLTRQTKRVYLPNASDCSWFLLRLQFLLNLLGNPEKKIPHYVHITGTNGKGSTALMLANILEKSSRGKIGLVTSPGLTGTLDRVSVNGTNISNTEFVRYVTKIKNAIPQYKKTSPYDIPSEFELLTAIAFLHLAAKKVTWAVVEVGLGGRYDSTNVIPHKDVAIITNIGHDHLDLIGPTLANVTYEKAGIIKPGCATITGENNPKLLNIIKKEALLQKSLLTAAPFKYTISKNNKNKFVQKFTYKNKHYTLNSLGVHQIQNAILAITAAQKLKIPQEAIASGLANTRLPIRLEVISKKPLIIIDGAHNREKMQSTVKAVASLKPTFSNLHLVLAFSADKDIPRMLKNLSKLKPTSVACTQFTLNQKRPPMPPKALAALATRYFPNTTIKSFLDPKKALILAKRAQQPSDLLLITGSMYLAGELRLRFDI